MGPGKVFALATAVLAKFGINVGSSSETTTAVSGTLLAPTAVVIGAATTDGVRLEVENGVLAVREGNDSASGSMSANGGLFGNTAGTGATAVGHYTNGISFGSAATVAWNSGVLNAGLDTGLARSAAGVVKVTDGSSGSGKLLVADGTAAAPAITGADTDSGVHFASNTVSFSTGGTQRFAADTTDAVLYLPLWGNYLKVNAYTSDTTLGVIAGSSVLSRVVTNEGAVGAVNLTLPAATAGYVLEAAVQANQYLRFTAATGDTIRDVGTVSATAGYIRSTTVGSTIRLVAINATQWVVMSKMGTWTIDS